MTAQLSLWNATEPALDRDSGIRLAIRESRHARRLILQTVPPRTIEVVVPSGAQPGAVESFVRAHRDWIRRAGQELIEAFPELDYRPRIVELKAIGASVELRYVETQGSVASYREDAGRLQLRCPTADFRDAPVLLRRWLVSEGRKRLKPWLLEESERTGLRPRGLQVRLQKTRWGSCSSSGIVSLNAALLLVPPELVRYLFIHELCHLVHLSHSKRYWQTVARHEPGFEALDRRLADCWTEMPAWLQFAESAPP